MYKSMEMIKIGKVAEMLGVTIKTLQNWDKNGLLIAFRTPTNRRYYTKPQLEEFLNGNSNNGKVPGES